jgi:TatD DNase family protein
MLVDAHCHLESIKGYTPKGVLPVTCGFSHSSNLQNIEIAHRLGIPFVLGIAPQTAIKSDLKDIELWVDTIRNAKPNAVGEIGLDFHWGKTEEDFAKERKVFDRMLELAERMKLPVVIHSRKAEKECVEYLKERKFGHGIMLHFFSGDENVAKLALDIGAYISFPPLRSKERRKVINSIPMENMLIETDAPYVVRLPEEVIKAAEYVAEVKRLEVDEVVERTAKNAMSLFRFKV